MSNVWLANMASSVDIIHTLIEEGNVAKAHSQIWWALRNRALPDFYHVMNNEGVRLFFHASNAGHYKLMFVALGKIFDSDSRASGVRALKETLRSEGKVSVANQIEADLAPISGLVEKVLLLRNRTVVHNEQDLPRDQAYQLNGGVTANQVRDVINAVGEAINAAAEAVGYPCRVTISDGFEDATLRMLEMLRAGQA